MTITEYLEAARRGEPGSEAALLEAVYGSLRAIAVNYLSHGAGQHTLNPTDLVHETYVRLLGKENSVWANRYHFFGAVSEAMRRIVIDHARKKSALKRTASNASQDTLQGNCYSMKDLDELLDLDEALKAFEQIEPVKSRIVKLKFFAGLTLPMWLRPWICPKQPSNAIGHMQGPGYSDACRSIGINRHLTTYASHRSWNRLTTRFFWTQLHLRLPLIKTHTSDQ